MNKNTTLILFFFFFTKVIPVLLHVLDLQLVATLSEDGFGVFLKAS